MRRIETIVKLCNLIIGLVLHAVACNAAALSLGNSRGTVQLGAPVDLFFEIQPDAGVSLAESCVKAQLVSGDVPIGSSKVQVVLLPELPGRASMVRVHAAAIVDEPVLTATISAGCSGSMSRTYTFLTQVPETAARGKEPLDIARLHEARPGAMTSGAPQAAVLPRVPVERAQPAVPPARVSAPVVPKDEAKAPAVRAPQPRQATAPAKPAQAVAKAAEAVVPSAGGRSAPARKAPTTPVSRLVMEPLELSAEDTAVPPLRATAEMVALPDKTNPTAREKAADAWRALNAEAQETAAPREDARVQALEAQLKAMQAKTAQERAALAELRARMESMEQERFASTWVYGLGLLLALAVGLMVWMWLRLRATQVQVERSWRDSVALAAAHDKAMEEHYGESTARDTWLDSDSSLPPDLPPPPVARQSVQAVPAMPKVVPKPAAEAHPLTVPAPMAFSAVEPKVESIVNLEELFDILQQADFFVSVGEHEQAIELLQTHIRDRGQQSPFAYLELLRLYHQLGRADDYESLRAQFLRHFNAQLPEYAQFEHQGQGLDHYVEALAEIEAQWTSSSVLALLESYLFLHDGVPAAHTAFELAAYDDLLLLLAIAQTTPASGRGAPPPRQRTTPFASSALPVMPDVERVNDWGTAEGAPPEVMSTRSIDSMIGDLALEPHSQMLPVEMPLSEAMLDLDLSDAPPILLPGELEIPAVKASAPAKPVGFGSTNDKIEFSFELEPQTPRKD